MTNVGAINPGGAEEEHTSYSSSTPLGKYREAGMGCSTAYSMPDTPPAHARHLPGGAEEEHYLVTCLHLMRFGMRLDSLKPALYSYYLDIDVTKVRNV